MTQENLNKIAIDILKTNIYLSLATTDGKIPWIAPLFYCLDDDYNFYFISQMESIHAMHVLKHPKVAFAIFDSHQPEGTGNGVQGLGIVNLLVDDTLVEGLKYYSTSFTKITQENLSEPSPYRLFKLTINMVYILDPNATTDQRVDVFIKHPTSLQIDPQ